MALISGGQASLPLGASRFKLNRVPPLLANRDACPPGSLFIYKQKITLAIVQLRETGRWLIEVSGSGF